MATKASLPRSQKRTVSAVGVSGAGPTRPPGPPLDLPQSVFISYSHRDAEWVELAGKHLRVLERMGLIECFQDREDIDPGDPWHRGIEGAINTSAIAICFLTPDYLDSKFCIEHEVPFLQRRWKAGKIRVVPVLLKDCLWDIHPFWSKFQVFSGENEKPLVNGNSSRYRAEQGFIRLARTIRQLVMDDTPEPPKPTSPAAGAGRVSRLQDGKGSRQTGKTGRRGPRGESAWQFAVIGAGMVDIGYGSYVQNVLQIGHFRMLCAHLRNFDLRDQAVHAEDVGERGRLIKLDGRLLAPLPWELLYGAQSHALEEPTGSGALDRLGAALFRSVFAGRRHAESRSVPTIQDPILADCDYIDHDLTGYGKFAGNKIRLHISVGDGRGQFYTSGAWQSLRTHAAPPWMISKISTITVRDLLVERIERGRTILEEPEADRLLKHAIVGAGGDGQVIGNKIRLYLHEVEKIERGRPIPGEPEADRLQGAGSDDIADRDVEDASWPIFDQNENSLRFTDGLLPSAQVRSESRRGGHLLEQADELLSAAALNISALMRTVPHPFEDGRLMQ